MPFESTRWSIVLRARDAPTAAARDALGTLCAAYWQPLYAFARRQGCDAEAAADLVQSYLATLVEPRSLRAVDPALGRFRSFLLASLRHFVSNTWDRERAARRGGGAPHVSLDDDHERSYLGVAAPDLDPEQIYERSWALTVLDRALTTLRETAVAAGERERVEALLPFVTGDGPEGSYREAGVPIGLSADAFKVAVHRLRRRFGEHLRAEIAQTVDDPRAVDDELRHLLSVLA